jgi:hypothetical protein
MASVRFAHYSPVIAASSPARLRKLSADEGSASRRRGLNCRLGGASFNSTPELQWLPENPLLVESNDQDQGPRRRRHRGAMRDPSR